MNPGIAAFLDLISHSEGTDLYGDQKGYNVIVGGQLFDSYADHPNIEVHLPKLNIISTAAGRYQITHKWWIPYKKQLNLPDFSPDSQDKVAIQMIREQKAYMDIATGDIAAAIDKCKNIWASLPGAGYGQKEQKLSDLLAFYQTRIGATA